MTRTDTRTLREMTRAARSAGQSRAARERSRARATLAMAVHDAMADALAIPGAPILSRALASMRQATGAMTRAARTLAGD